MSGSGCSFVVRDFLNAGTCVVDEGFSPGFPRGSGTQAPSILSLKSWMGPQGQLVAAGVRRRRDHQKLRESHRAHVSGSPCRKPGFLPSSLVRDHDIGDRLGDDEIHVRTSTRTSHPPGGHSSPPRLTPARPADLAHVRRGPPHPSSPGWRAPPPCSPRSASSQSLFLGPPVSLFVSSRPASSSQAQPLVAKLAS